MGLITLTEDLIEIAEIIAWNIFQMDGLKYVVPNSCHEETTCTDSLFEEASEVVTTDCHGCFKGANFAHNGDYSKIMDWDSEETIRFVDFISS